MPQYIFIGYFINVYLQNGFDSVLFASGIAILASGIGFLIRNKFKSRFILYLQTILKYNSHFTAEIFSKVTYVIFFKMYKNKKAEEIKRCFDSISKEYDCLNRIITFGTDAKNKEEIGRISKEKVN